MILKNCTVIVDDSDKVLTVISKYGATVCKIKFEDSGWGTMERVEEKYDTDNWWVAFKPSDSVIFENNLFSRKKKVVIHHINYDVIER